MSAIVGYGPRLNQWPIYDDQLERLKAVVSTVVRTEKVSGRSRNGRSELATEQPAKLERFMVRVNRLGFPNLLRCDSSCVLGKGASMHDATLFERSA